MRPGSRNLLVIVAIAAVASAGCAAQSVTPAPTASPAPSATPTPAPALLSYSKVVSTYKADVRLCGAVGDWFKGAIGFDVTCADVIHFGGAGAKADTVIASVGGTRIEVSSDVFRDYGVKVVLDVGTTLGSTAYPTGAMLTVDADQNWTQVSSWD